MNEEPRETILYSSLNFGEIKSIPKLYDENTRKNTIDIIPFSEDILGDADMVCKVTVINSEKKSLCYCRKLQDVYQVRIDKIYYSEEEVNEGEIIEIQNMNFFNCGLPQSESEILKDHQYILPIRSSTAQEVDSEKLGGIIPKSQYGIVYPYAHPIEVTKDDEFIFHCGWKSLINENTFDVILNDEDSKYEDLFYMDQIKLRRDEGFEGILQH